MERTCKVVGKIPNFSQFPKRKSSSRGAKKDVSTVYVGHKNKMFGLKYCPRVKLWAIFGNLWPGKWPMVL
eukprot:533633-Pelagomonas_calceolata.AAC.3